MSELDPAQITALAWPVAFVFITGLLMLGYVLAEIIKRNKKK